jgi:cytochrome c biogenesis protein CcmG/thiol:disulfide interchange protein DsbE
MAETRTPSAGRRGGTIRTIVVGMLVAAVVVAAAVAFEGRGRRDADPETAAGGFGGISSAQPYPLPDAELPQLGAPGALRLGGPGELPVVVNFWATWCAPCVEELPVLAEAARALEGQVRFIGINVQDREEAALRLAREAGLDFPLVVDARAEYYEAVGAAVMPTTLFVQPDGTVAYRRGGELDAERFAELLRERLGVDWRPAS